MKIVIAGPPRSGKSCLRYALRKAVTSVSQGQHYLYFITAAPDGEGAWFHETYQRDADEAISLRDQYKYPISPQFTERLAAAVACCDAPLCALDIGGRVSDENRQICANASHAILIAGDHPQQGSWNERLEPWRQFCNELNLTVLAELHSDYESDADEIRSPKPSDPDPRNIAPRDRLLRARVHRLERGEPIEQRPAIVALAQHLLDVYRDTPPSISR